MGTLTGAQMESEIKANLGNRDDLDSRLYRFLNWAQEYIARQWNFRELQEIDTTCDTVASQAYISQPTGIKNLISIRVLDGTSSRKLVYIPRREFDKWIAKPDEYTEGTPSHYTSWGSRFYLWRIPDAIYQTEIQYEKWPTEFAAASSATSDLMKLDQCIIHLATAHALASLKDMGGAFNYHTAQGEKLLAVAIKNDKQLFSDEEIKPDYSLSKSGPEYYADPFIRRQP